MAREKGTVTELGATRPSLRPLITSLNGPDYSGTLRLEILFAVFEPVDVRPMNEPDELFEFLDADDAFSEEELLCGPEVPPRGESGEVGDILPEFRAKPD